MHEDAKTFFIFILKESQGLQLFLSIVKDKIVKGATKQPIHSFNDN